MSCTVQLPLRRVPCQDTDPAQVRRVESGGQPWPRSPPPPVSPAGPAPRWP
ncbi:hypothetical protein [Ornithinimicrobium kibberense]|uniref:hypothetical protein n=1 Tax=Ornithinimicrobium kibberense TaxID=282060 RepID=UPI00360A956E